MTRSEVESLVAAAIDAESKRGLRWWPGVSMAPIAYRRWVSFARRNKSKRPKLADRILDLAKGMQAHFEPDIKYNPLSEWVCLAKILADVLAKEDS
jgi:hypothetical protein